MRASHFANHLFQFVEFIARFTLRSHVDGAAIAAGGNFKELGSKRHRFAAFGKR